MNHVYTDRKREEKGWKVNTEQRSRRTFRKKGRKSILTILIASILTLPESSVISHDRFTRTCQFSLFDNAGEIFTPTKFSRFIPPTPGSTWRSNAFQSKTFDSPSHNSLSEAPFPLITCRQKPQTDHFWPRHPSRFSAFLTKIGEVISPGTHLAFSWACHWNQESLLFMLGRGSHKYPRAHGNSHERVSPV